MTYQELQTEFELAKRRLVELGYTEVLNNRYKLVWNTRALKRIGQCKTLGRNYHEININKRYADVDPKSVRDTVMHELIHSLCPRDGHGSMWSRIVNDVNRKYGYRISRTAQACPAYNSLLSEQYKYTIVCEHCGMKTHRNRASRLVTNINNYKCGRCGSKLKLINIG